MAAHFFHGLFHELHNVHSLILHIFTETKYIVAVETRSVRVLIAIFFVCLCLFFSLITCNISNSLTLTAFTHLLVFDLLYLLVALTSLWTRRKSATLAGYTLGYERFDVVAVFAAAILAVLSSFFEFKEAVERIFEPPEIYPRSMIFAVPVAFLVHLFVVYGIENPAFNHVILSSGSSWLQEHTTDMSRTLCRFVPALTRFLLPRVNPFALVGVGASSVLLIVYWMTSRTDGDAIAASLNPLSDTLGGVVVSLMLFGTMIPIMLYSGRILLQTVPAHLAGQLDKAFREASTLDGVLELRNEHVWSVGFANLAGSVYVRVRRDANEQLVLAQVTNRLCSLIKYLTVEVYKDDWTRTTSTFTWPPVQVGIPIDALLHPTKPLTSAKTHPTQSSSMENMPNGFDHQPVMSINHTSPSDKTDNTIKHIIDLKRL